MCFILLRTLQPDYDTKKAIAAGGKELANLQELAESEADDNELEFKRRKGDPVQYGQVLQLYHSHSRRYVRISSTTTSRREQRFVVLVPLLSI